MISEIDLRDYEIEKVWHNPGNPYKVEIDMSKGSNNLTVVVSIEAINDLVTALASQQAGEHMLFDYYSWYGAGCPI
jgi:hypothetical protein